MTNDEIFLVCRTYRNFEEWEETEDLYAAADLRTAKAKFNEWREEALADLAETGLETDFEDKVDDKGLPCWDGVVYGASLQYEVRIFKLTIH